MIHWILQFALRIAFRCVLHRSDEPRWSTARVVIILLYIKQSYSVLHSLRWVSERICSSRLRMIGSLNTQNNAFRSLINWRVANQRLRAEAPVSTLSPNDRLRPDQLVARHPKRAGWSYSTCRVFSVETLSTVRHWIYENACTSDTTLLDSHESAVERTFAHYANTSRAVKTECARRLPHQATH